MKELKDVVRAAVAVAKTRADARRATEDGASEKALEKYRAAFSKALDGLEGALEALSKIKPAPVKQGPAFDWAGIAKAGIAVAKAVVRAKRNGRGPQGVVDDIVDGEIVG